MPLVSRSACFRGDYRSPISRTPHTLALAAGEAPVRQRLFLITGHHTIISGAIASIGVKSFTGGRPIPASKRLSSTKERKAEAPQTLRQLRYGA
jgi:hypothetical protein